MLFWALIGGLYMYTNGFKALEDEISKDFKV